MIVMNGKPIKSIGHFEENLVFCRLSPIFVGLLSKVDQSLQFLTKCSQLKSIKNKNEQYCTVRLFIFKAAETFWRFLSAIVSIFFRVYSKVKTLLDKYTHIFKELLLPLNIILWLTEGQQFLINSSTDSWWLTIAEISSSSYDTSKLFDLKTQEIS